MMFLQQTARSIVSKANLFRAVHVSARLCANEVQEGGSRLEYREISKDRTKVVPLETSLKYMKSPAYKQTYGENPVWVLYRRNHKGSIPPRKTRKTCIRSGHISTGNPCPICRDEYLVLHEENIDLLKQFICPYTGSVLSYTKTGLCQHKHFLLTVCIDRAKDRGYITYDVPVRTYDYSEYFKPEETNS